MFYTLVNYISSIEYFIPYTKPSKNNNEDEEPSKSITILYILKLNSIIPNISDQLWKIGISDNIIERLII